MSLLFSTLLNTVYLQIIYIIMIYSLYIRPSCKPLLSCNFRSHVYYIYYPSTHHIGVQLIYRILKEQKKERKKESRPTVKMCVVDKKNYIVVKEFLTSIHTDFKATVEWYHNTPSQLLDLYSRRSLGSCYT